MFYASGCLTDRPDALCIQAVRPLVRAYDRTYHVPGWSILRPARRRLLVANVSFSLSYNESHPRGPSVFGRMLQCILNTQNICKSISRIVDPSYRQVSRRVYSLRTLTNFL